MYFIVLVWNRSSEMHYFEWSCISNKQSEMCLSNCKSALEMNKYSAFPDKPILESDPL